MCFRDTQSRPVAQGFSLKGLRHLVLDEADRLLNMDFEQEIDQILKCVPKERRTQLFSATMTTKVTALCRPGCIFLSPNASASPCSTDGAGRLCRVEISEGTSCEVLRQNMHVVQQYLLSINVQVAKLQRACLQNPVKVEVSQKYTTVDTLRQQYIFFPAKHKVYWLCRRRPVFQDDCSSGRCSITNTAVPATAAPTHIHLGRPA